MDKEKNQRPDFESGYAEVNGLRMYYETYGRGKPLVLIHGGGSTIQTSFGRVIGPLAKTRRVVGVELQAHGRTGDRDADLSFEQDADDLAALMQSLGISQADFFGFSNGGTTALQVAIRHPQLVRKIVLGSALCNRSGVSGQFWDFMQQARLDNMPQPLKDAYTKLAPYPGHLQIMHDKDVKGCLTLKIYPTSLLKLCKPPRLS